MYKKQVTEGLLISKVVNAEVRSRLTVLDTELQQAYSAKQQQYQVAGGQTVSHILFLWPPYVTEQDEERLRTKAESVLRQLRNGGDFAALARQYSDGPSAETAGLLGTFQPGERRQALKKPQHNSSLVRLAMSCGPASGCISSVLKPAGSRYETVCGGAGRAEDGNFT